jgi:hypothetical protein
MDQYIDLKVSLTTLQNKILPTSWAQQPDLATYIIDW